MMFPILLLISFAPFSKGNSELYSVLKESVEDIRECSDPTLLSCKRIDLNLDLVKSGESVVIPDGNCKLDQIGDPLLGSVSTSYHYENVHEDSAIITLNNEEFIAYGEIHCGAQVFEIAYCGDNCHVLKEEDPSQFTDEEAEELDRSFLGQEFLEAERKREASQLADPEDRSTVVTTIKVYYTPEVLQNKPGLDTFIDMVIAETNQGYINSGVQMHLVLYDKELSVIHDQGSISGLQAFAKSKGSPCKLRGGADMAMLLMYNTDVCGRAYSDVLSTGLTVGLTAVNCALGYYSFGHEIAHHFGATHNREANPNEYVSYGYGYLIKTQSGAASGMRTIMAYYDSNHKTRINYYSRQVVISGYVLGDANNDNSKVLNERRYQMAQVGTETCVCINSYSSCSNWSSHCTTNMWVYTVCPYTCGQCFVYGSAY